MTNFRLAQKAGASLLVLPLMLALGACSTADHGIFGPHATAGYGSSSPPSALASPIVSSPYRYSPYEHGRSLPTRGPGGP